VVVDVRRKQSSLKLGGDKMYAISNSQQEEIRSLLAALSQLPGNDNRTANLKRKAKIAITKLHKAKKIK
jgi:hypothetical protein